MKKILIFLTLSLSALFLIWGIIPEAVAVTNQKLDSFNDSRFINTTSIWEEWIFRTLVRFAMDLKNLFYIIATVFFLVISLRLILASNTEEELWKFKKWIIWITIWLIVMQIALVFVESLYRPEVSTSLAFRLFNNVVLPFINLLQLLASFFFIAIAIYAFYRLVTANGNEEAISSGKKTIWFALIGFIVIRFAMEIVEAFYGRVNCTPILDTWLCENVQNLSEAVNIIITIINWLNAFVAIVVVIMILYAWAQILLSAGDEEKLKKSKNSLIFIAIWIFILIANFLILTFFLSEPSLSL